MKCSAILSRPFETVFSRLGCLGKPKTLEDAPAHASPGNVELSLRERFTSRDAIGTHPPARTPVPSLITAREVEHLAANRLLVESRQAVMQNRALDPGIRNAARQAQSQAHTAAAVARQQLDAVTSRLAVSSPQRSPSEPSQRTIDRTIQTRARMLRRKSELNARRTQYAADRALRRCATTGTSPRPEVFEDAARAQNILARAQRLSQ